MKYLIFDKDENCINEIKAYLKSNGFFWLGTFDYLNDIKNYNPDFIIIDIANFEDTWLDFLQNIPINVSIIIISEKTEFAIQTYLLENVVGYLQKPLNLENFVLSLNRVEKYCIQNSIQTDFFFIKSGRKYIKINIPSVKYITGLKDYCLILTENGNFSTAMNIRTIYNQLDQNVFIRVNKSYIVNYNFIDFIERDAVVVGTEKISIGNLHKTSFMKFVNTKLLKK